MNKAACTAFGGVRIDYFLSMSLLLAAWAHPVPLGKCDSFVLFLLGHNAVLPGHIFYVILEQILINLI